MKGDWKCSEAEEDFSRRVFIMNFSSREMK